MAGASLLTLIDDIASLLDDVAAMTKVAASKTSGVLGDDLALNAEQVAGVRAARELPVVWAVAKGSFKNKLILLPLALILSSYVPWLVLPLLMIGGLYLCFEGAEKLLHNHQADSDENAQSSSENMFACDGDDALLEMERNKIQGAIRTDFILSAEIMIITLGTVAHATFMTRLGVMSLTAILMTVGVYGVVAAIIKLDDAGLYLQRRSAPRSFVYQFGTMLVSFAPILLRFLAMAGTVAMFTVGGGILSHGIPYLHHISGALEQYILQLTQMSWLSVVAVVIADAIAGILAGLAAAGMWIAILRIKRS